MVFENLPVLPVALPLLMAAAVAVTRRSFTAWALTALAFLGGLAMAVTLALQPDALSYALGGHLPPIGIEYRLDGLNRYLLLIVAFIGAAMIPYAKASIAHEIGEARAPLFYAALLLCYAGLNGILLTGDIFNIYVFVEIAALATYALVALGEKRQARLAAFEYLILGTLGATFFLIGVFFLYAGTGTLNLTDLRARLEGVPLRVKAAGFAFLMLGLFLKMGVVPLHRWLIGAYTFAPSFVSAFVGAVGAKVMIYLLVRMAWTLFGAEATFGDMHLGPVLLLLGAAGIVVGTFVAIRQHNVKRMLAYSSLAQIGYILLGIGLATEAGLAAALAHTGNHALAKGALFLAAGCVYFRTGGVALQDFAGAGRQMPWTMGAFALAGLSLIGIPGTAGFVGKWMLLTALLQEGSWLLFALVLLSSLLAFLYIGKVLEAAYFTKATSPRKEAPLMLVLPTLFLALANVYFGFFTTWTAGMAQEAAMLLAGG